MDPNTALAQLRQASEWMERYTDEAVDKALIDDIMLSFEALDDWLSRGGFLPDDWKRKV